MNLTFIRTVRPHDLRDICKVEERCFGADTRFPPDAVANMIASPDVSGLVLEADGSVKGFVFQNIPRRSGESVLLTIDIDPDLRRRGYGRALLRSAIDIARGLGKRRMLLQVRKGNAAAIALYRSLGFEKTGLLKDYYGAGGDAWEMELGLR